jgi:hypothetical protein
MKRRFQFQTRSSQAFFLKDDSQWLELIARNLIAHIAFLRRLRQLTDVATSEAGGPDASRPSLRFQPCRSSRPWLVRVPRHFAGLRVSPWFGGRV